MNAAEAKKILADKMLLGGYDMILDLDRSRGMWLYDKLADKKYLDFYGFIASSPLGMNHPKLLEPEFLNEMKRVAVNKVANPDLYTEELAEFVEALSRISPEYMRYFFFISGGALAVENALKTAFDWKVQKNLEASGKEDTGYRIMHLKGAFHGRSGYTLSLTNTFDPRIVDKFPKFDWPRVSNPMMKFPLNEGSLKDVEERENRSIAEMEAAIAEYGNDIAGFIMEPIQGEGGDNHFRKEYFHSVRKLLNENDILFILDEVQSGMGITGKWWAHEHFDVEPDVMVFGKKTQVSGIMAGPRVDEVKDNVFHTLYRINSTFGGNLVDMFRAKKFIEIMIEDNILDQVNRVGAHAVKRLEELQEKHGEFFSNARGRGLMDAIDLPNAKVRDRYLDRLYENGLICISCGERGVRFRPPLIAEEEDIDTAIEIMEQSVKGI